MIEATIRALGPDLLDDYLAFFDRDAFADNPEWASCYCRAFHWTGSDEGWEAATAGENREAVSALIRAGGHRGYLAYVADRPVAWCHAAPRLLLPALDQWYPIDDAGQVGSIVCFIVAPAYRRRGLARRLLDAACEGFARQGLAVAEAYPARQAATDARHFPGPLAMYLEAGFVPFRELRRYLIVRRALRRPGGG